MNLIKPKKLKIGDTIAIIAPAGNVSKDKILNSKNYFEKQGYKVKLGTNIFNKEDYLAGDDEERLSDIHNAFLDKSVDAIICARGGYGTLRLIDKIDYEIIRNNPKIFCGFSDITILNTMFLKKSNLITFSAPMAQSDFSQDIENFTEYNFFQTINNGIFELKPTNLEIYKQGEAQGILIGGNLSSLTSLCGQDFIPEQDFILFVEDLNEPIYKLDRYFTQLFLMENFRKYIKAIVVGEFLDIDKQDLDIFFKKLAATVNIPILGQYPVTHSKQKATIPYGAAASISNGEIRATNFMVE